MSLMTNKPNPRELKKLLSIDPKSLKEHLKEGLLLQQNIVTYLDMFQLKKEEVMKACDFSESQYYRSRNNAHRWDIDSLIKILELVSKKT